MRNNSKIIIYFCTFFNALRMIVGATSSLYLLACGITLVELGFLKSMQSIIFFLLDIPTSYLADKYSRKWAIICACFLSGLWLLITGLANNVTIFFIAEIFNAISLTIMGGVAYAYIIDNSQAISNTENILHHINKLQYFFMAISSLIGALFYIINPRVPWILAGIICLLMSALGAYILPKAITITHRKKTDFLSTIISIKTMPRNTILKGINLALLLVFFQIILQYWQVILKEVLVLQKTALFYAIVFAFILLAQSIAGYIGSKKKAKNKLTKLTNWLALLFPFFCLILAITKNYNLFIIFIIISFGVIQMVIAQARAAYHIALPSYNRSVYESLATSFSKILAVLFIPLIAYEASFFGWSVSLASFSLLCIMNIYINNTKQNSETTN